MCYHRRLLYGACNHSAWLAKAQSCETEKAFEAGSNAVGCSWMFAHPLTTTRVDRLCPKCVRMRAWSDAMIGKIRTLLRTLQEDVARRLGASDGRGDETDGEASKLDSRDLSGMAAELASWIATPDTTELPPLAPSARDEETPGRIVVSQFHSV
ncbi:hypothetical protein QBC33DRAFT_497320 [Phialemonium atrogriseum]|uniref:Uncharacterized protein n=1 Tax=Phialemonium atrogriseum TaxID=1093897 RepID=A0AAJ0FL28_9PEZI|nr:uncharacterized protein QBC33DRAFT_497320 [Phialemonium atrogriseum]KAK1764685.1 hypothetical protein QBC33DRAFT_497320 [Phialemonium atrogriseum]